MKTLLRKLTILAVLISIGCNSHVYTTCKKSKVKIMCSLTNISTLMAGRDTENSNIIKYIITAENTTAKTLSALTAEGVKNTFVNSGGSESVPSGKITSSIVTHMYLPVDLISYSATGNKLTHQMIESIENAKPGTKVYFEDIKAVGPDGKTRYLNSICLTLK